MKEYDFSGWATKNNIECSDGRTIMRDAFKDNDGQKVPLVWNHDHNSPDNVLGHALLENREEGVYAYCKFNETESGQQAKALVINGDVDKLSIYANKLKSQANKVMHGIIREVSLVLAGANPGAYIDSVIVHSDDSGDEEEGTIYTDEHISVDIENHDDEGGEEVNTEETQTNVTPGSEITENSESSENNEGTENVIEHSDDKTIEDVFNTLNEEQKTAVYAVIGQLIEDKEDGENNDKKEGEDNMKHNVFDNDKQEETLMHSEIAAAAIADAKRYGSMKESFIEHAAINNIDDIELLFPDAHPLNYEPKMIEEDNSWVAKVMKDVKHSPFSRVKATFGRLTEPEARAKGYIKKGEKKANIKMAVLNRVTTPTTVYIKNEIDRDDVIDITNFDVVAWQKKEMRKQLDKELALAMLLGDDRDPSDPYKISELNIRPVLNDDDMYTIQYVITEGRDYKITDGSYSENDARIKGIIRGAIKSRKQYKGSGKPTFYTTEDCLNDLLLLEDQNGRVLYDSIEKLATAMRVKEIVTIPEMEKYTDVYGIIVNLNDYTAGADKGGSVAMFDDFDIDYNQMKYLMETRMSGALVVPYSAIVLRKTAKAEDEAEG